MLQITSQQKLLLAVECVDFRKGIDGLASVCKDKLNKDPFSGIVFAFANRRKTAVKILMFDSNGFYLTLKRFSKGKLAWCPSCKQTVQKIQAQALQVLLCQGDPRFMHTPAPWKNHATDAIIDHAASNPTN